MSGQNQVRYVDLPCFPHSGMHVEASDGKVGRLDALVLDPKNGDVTHILIREGHLWDKKDVTHLLMREGHLWDKKDVAIPVSGAYFSDKDTVYLKLDKAAVKKLPAVAFK